MLDYKAKIVEYILEKNIICTFLTFLFFDV